MDIVIISEFGEDFSKTDNDRFLYLAKILSKRHNIEIITSSFQHSKKLHRRKTIYTWDFKVTFIEEPGYPKNVCLKRFYSHFIFGKNLIRYIKDRNKKPDVIYCAVPSLSGPYKIAKYCQKNNIRFVIDVQDLWPEAFNMVFNVPVISKALFFPFRVMANGIYKRADSICSVSDTYCKRALKVNNKVKITTTVFLGTDLSIFDNYAKEDSILKKEEGEIWIGYCGTLGDSYDITCVIDSLVVINNPLVKFIVMGDGPLMERFKMHAKKNNANVIFMGRIPYDKMCSLLCSCDITVNPISHNAAQSIINKHADYAASGLPVVSTQECEEYKALVYEYHMGYNCNNNDSDDLAIKLSKLIKDPKLRIKLGENSRKCAEEKFDRKNTYNLLVQAIIGEQ